MTMIVIEDKDNGNVWINASMVMDVYPDGESYQIMMNVWDHEQCDFRRYLMADDPIPAINEAVACQAWARR